VQWPDRCNLVTISAGCSCYAPGSILPDPMISTGFVTFCAPWRSNAMSPMCASFSSPGGLAAGPIGRRLRGALQERCNVWQDREVGWNGHSVLEHVQNTQVNRVAHNQKVDQTLDKEVITARYSSHISQHIANFGLLSVKTEPGPDSLICTARRHPLAHGRSPWPSWSYNLIAWGDHFSFCHEYLHLRHSGLPADKQRYLFSMPGAGNWITIVEVP
jgi:hypothetical protein